MKKFLIFTLAILIMFSPMSSRLAQASSIDNSQFKQELNYWIGKNVMSPNVDPRKPVTRGEFASYIARAFSLPVSTKYTFKDLKPTNSLTVEIQNAAGAGILSGYPDGTFQPNKQITRQQMAGMLYKVLRYEDVQVDEVQLAFKDSAKIHASFTKAVSINAHLNIIRGGTEKTGVYFYPKNNATIGHASAFLFRMVAAIDKLKPPVVEKPSPEIPVEKDGYQLDTIVNGQLVKGSIYNTYDEALNKWQAGTQVITNNNRIVKMSSGMAITNGFTVIYDESKVNSVTYVTTDTELQYLGSDQDWVNIQFAGRIGYVKQANVNLTPYTMVKNRSSYSVVNGELRHTLYYPSKNTTASFIMGKAPSFMVPNKTYYSWNGTHFFDGNSVDVGEAYSYYQFLPARTKTNYTADEIDGYILQQLTVLENLYKSNPTTYAIYKDATTVSKLRGLGPFLKQVEEQYKVNALMILALAQHESSYGMSKEAKTNNNFFGLYVYDTNPLNKVFPSVEANITELITQFWNKNYIPPTASYANGAAFGNKYIGFNVKYASDPYWGEKAAGHYYRIDKALGFKDAGTYRIGMTNIAGLNVRRDPSTNIAAAYRYKNSNMPVVILNSDVNGWMQVGSDLLDPTPLYISKQYVNELNIIK